MSALPLADQDALGFGSDDFVDTWVFLPNLKQSIITFAEQNFYIGLFGICPRSTTLPGSSIPMKIYLEDLEGEWNDPKSVLVVYGWRSVSYVTDPTCQS